MTDSIQSSDPSLSRSSSLADAVALAAASVVRVAARCSAPASGFILDGGRIVTSAAALGDAEEVIVSIDERSSKATRLGRDRASDVALLQLEDHELGRAIPLVADRELRVGDVVLALGRPGRAIRASSRIIGALADGIQLPGGMQLDRYIESDRRLPRGFAGGPLIDREGRAIGLNTRQVVRGADLCIPASTLQRLATELSEHGQIQRGYLGVSVHAVPLPEAARDALQLSQQRGALVMALQHDGPAARGGLLVGDIIVSLDAEPIHGPRALRAALFSRPDQELTLALIRAGQSASATLQSGAQPA